MLSGVVFNIGGKGIDHREHTFIEFYRLIWLVVWNMWIIFPFSWECHDPN